MDAQLTKSERETLKAIYRLTSGRGRAGDATAPAAPGEMPSSPSAHTGDLADGLGVSPGTMTAVIKRLADRGLVHYARYRGVGLTALGRQQAVRVIRRHRIVERFLADFLGYAWNEADRLAPSFEHELPDEVEDRLFAALHHPSTCPHGFPIPDPEGTEIPTMPALYALEPGDVAVVALSGSTDQEVVDFLDALGLRPGVEVEVREKQPFDGPLVLRVAGQDRTLGERVAKQIFVRKHSNGTPAPAGDLRKEPTS